MHVLSKLFETLFLKGLKKPILEDGNLIPEHQFWFEEQHAFNAQVQQEEDFPNKAFGSKKILSNISIL